MRRKRVQISAKELQFRTPGAPRVLAPVAFMEGNRYENALGPSISSCGRSTTVRDSKSRSVRFNVMVLTLSIGFRTHSILRALFGLSFSRPS